MIKELRVGNYVAYKGKPSLVCALDYDRSESFALTLL